MAIAKPELIAALRLTADRLSDGERYSWSHMGNCNCGHLAQTITQYSGAQIHSSALRRSGDWSEQVIDYCPTSGFAIDDIITAMLNMGLNTSDLQHLERLSDQRVLRRFPVGERYLKHNVREDVVAYMRAWADLLQTDLEQVRPIEQPFYKEEAVAVH